MFNKERFRKNSDILFFLLGMIPLTWMLLRKCRFGFSSIDESFYLTIPYRFSQGDTLFLSEWHLSQLSGLILQFPMAVFLRLTGSTEGITLAFRLLYVAAHLCGCLVLFFLLRKKTGFGAAAVVMIYYVFAPYGISALSYNSMGVGCLSLAAAILVCADAWWSDVLSGFFYAMAVLCCPYLAILFVIYGVVVLLSRRKQNALPFAAPRRFLFFFIGIALPALCVLASFLPRIRPGQYAGILEGMLSDPEHSTSFVQKLQSLAVILRDSWCFVFLGLTLFCALCVKKDALRRLLDVLVLTLTAYRIYVSQKYINYLMFPLNMTGFYFYVVYRRSSLRNLFYGMWIPGVLYGLLIHLSSNQGFYAVSSAMTVSMIPSVMISAVTLKELRREIRPVCFRYLLPGLLAACLVLLGALEIPLRWNFFFHDRDMPEQSQMLMTGPQKWIVVTPDREREYLAIAELSEQLDSGSSLLVLGQNPHLYLFGSHTNCGWSAWNDSSDEGSLSRLLSYYALNPDKWPEQIVALPGYAHCVSYFETEMGYVQTYQAADGTTVLTKTDK